jgi:hypothetical protein
VKLKFFHNLAEIPHDGGTMTKRQRRHDHTPRYGVSPQCKGHGLHTVNGSRVEFRGVDVSHHGFGCVMVGNFQNRDTLILDIGGSKIPFEVMWVESHLGIENTYRVGLQCLDRMLDVRGKLSALGMVTVPLDDEFAA